MLIKITNYCSMGCSHCMENSTPAGEHMTRETFLAALALTERLEGLAWKRGVPRWLLISGGEATEHPDVLWFLETARATGARLILITNGMWLDNPELRAKILRPDWPDLMVQVTNDPRFYPTAPKAVPTDDPRVVFVPSLTVLVTLGRLKQSRLPPDAPPIRKGPTSFNLRSLTRSFGDVREALYMLRARAAMGMSGNCSPSISNDGTIVAGETSNCFPIGDVNSTAADVTRALVSMQCNKCGLVDNLSQAEKHAIGEARILTPEHHHG
jgi:hypothetical protein